MRLHLQFILPPSPPYCTPWYYSLLVYKIRLLREESTLLTLASFASCVFHSSSGSRGISVRPSWKRSSGSPWLLSSNAKMSMWSLRPDRIWGLTSVVFPKPLSFGLSVPDTSSCLGLLHLLFPIHGKIYTATSFSWRSQLKRQIFLTTMGKQPFQSPPHTKLYCIFSTNFFSTPHFLITNSHVYRLFPLTDSKLCNPRN